MSGGRSGSVSTQRHFLVAFFFRSRFDGRHGATTGLLRARARARTGACCDGGRVSMAYIVMAYIGMAYVVMARTGACCDGGRVAAEGRFAAGSGTEGARRTAATASTCM